MISSKIGHSLDPAILKVYRFFFKDKIINPNVLTTIGALFGYVSSLYIALDYPIVAGITLLISGFFDLLDGALARQTKNTTLFGGFLDSVLDRYTDLFVLYGVCIYFFRKFDFFYSLVTIIAMIGVAIIPYAKARAEAASLRCNTGILERAERLAILLIGLFFNLMPYCIVVLAIFSHVTVIQRIVFVYKEANKRKNG